jgi:hypothetical protein
LGESPDPEVSPLIELVAAKLAVDVGDFEGTLIVIFHERPLEDAVLSERGQLIVEGHIHSSEIS